MPKMPLILQKLKPKPKPQAQPQPKPPKPAKPTKAVRQALADAKAAERLQDFRKKTTEPLSKLLHAKLPAGAAFVGELTWGLGRDAKGIADRRAFYRGHAERVAQELADLEQVHGSKFDVGNAYAAIHGCPITFVKETLNKKTNLPERKLQKITQPGLLKVLKNAQKFDKLKGKKLARHIAEVDGVTKLIGGISNSHGLVPGEIKSLQAPLDSYLQNLKKLHSGDIDAGDITFNAKALLVSVKQHQKPIKDSAIAISRLLKKEALYRTAEYWSNTRGYWELRRLAGDSLVNKFPDVEAAIEKLHAKEGGGELPVWRKPELASLKTSLQAMVKAAEKNGVLTAFNVEMAPGRNISMFYIPEKRLQETVKTMRDKVGARNDLAWILTAAGAGVTAAAVHMELSAAKEAALKSGNAALTAQNQDLAGQLATWTEAARQQASQNDLFRQILESQQQWGVLPPGESGSAPLVVPDQTALPAGESGFAPFIAATGVTVPLAKLAWFVGGPLFGPLAIVGGLIAAPAAARTGMREGRLYGGVRRMTAEDIRNTLKPIETPEKLSDHERALNQRNETQLKKALGPFKPGSTKPEDTFAYHSDYFFPNFPSWFRPGTGKGLFIIAPKGHLPQAVASP